MIFNVNIPWKQIRDVCEGIHRHRRVWHYRWFSYDTSSQAWWLCRIFKLTYAFVIAIWQVKKKKRKLEKHVKSTSCINENNWILILNNSNKLVIHVDNKKGCGVLPSLSTFSPSQKQCTLSCHLTSIYISANYFEALYVEW